MKTVVALAAKEFTSLSADLSLLQEEYQNLFRAELEAREVSSPSQLDDDQLSEFFTDVSAKWKARKLQLFKEGKIDDSKL
ncbi:hypothetical protein JA33_071 [Dickeya phage vB_DsoM_JA33]|uniref:Uncharacterized protein n=2 Tax=Salmondvirus JA11 TaxID=2734141 RepID=A0A386K590_9CAUD|nr:hypothetical protein HOU32_gp071 [Dickeya phage vB_DsoM_JA11]AXG67445.1 hypothetical protein JA33_071 [Dickeya phage vB_DsoM_JA33]AYD79876.1 hypothetical protein JA11_071 [Dickeya phage vB_DsoM_JA11]